VCFTQALASAMSLANVLVVCDGGRPLRAFARRAKIPVRVVPAPGKPPPGEPDIHINNLNAAYHSRLNEWMRRFHSVATRNLPNYLGCAALSKPPPNQSIHKAGYSQPWAKELTNSLRCKSAIHASGFHKKGAARLRKKRTWILQRARQRAEAGARPRPGSAAGPVSRSRSKEGVFFALCCRDLSIHYGLHRRGSAKRRMGARAGPFGPERIARRARRPRREPRWRRNGGDTVEFL
jgi:hypothetical protein